jgi:hypothetical protein
MCLVPALLGKAIGGRTGGIIGAGLGGGIPGALMASQLFKKKPAPVTTSASAPNPYGG